MPLDPIQSTTSTATLTTDTAAELENRPVLLSIALIFKKKQWKRKPVCLGKEETSTRKGKKEEVDEAGYCKTGSSQEQEGEEADLIKYSNRLIPVDNGSKTPLYPPTHTHTHSAIHQWHTNTES